MAEKMYYEIDKASIPYEFDADLAGEIFTFEVNYNGRFDFFTIDLYKNGALVIAGEKLVYGQPLFEWSVDSRLPKIPLTPQDFAGQYMPVNYENLGKTVFLIVGEA